MDNSEYKKITSQPNAMKRSAILRTSDLLKENEKITSWLKQQLENSPVEKPPEFSGTDSEEFFVLPNETELIEDIVNTLMELEADLVGNGRDSAPISEVVDLLDKWNSILMEY